MIIVQKLDKCECMVEINVRWGTVEEGLIVQTKVTEPCTFHKRLYRRISKNMTSDELLQMIRKDMEEDKIQADKK